jgi:Tol biopolymer transport system component
LAWPEFFEWASALVSGIHAAHERGVVHRDIKPANVMGASGRIKVLDFGISKIRPALAAGRLATMTTEQVTGPQQVIGTAAYMSPEQAEGRAVDARSDIFSLGVVLYEMATGTRPFDGDTGLALLSSIIKDPMPSLAERRRDAPPDLERIIRRCLAKDPERRYQTTLDLRNDLDELQQRAGDGQTHTVRHWTGRRWLAAAATIVMVLIGVAGSRVWRTTATPRGSAGRVTFDHLTSQPGIEWFPSLSPDGKWLIYAGDAAGNRDIYLQSVGGQTPINLTADSTADDDQPAFSPDGEQVVFRSNREGGGLFVMGRTGEGVRRLTKTGFNPSWSRDGKSIAYTTFRLELRPQNTEGVSELFVVGANGGEPRRVTEVDAALPTWSPDGTRLAFGSRRGGSDRRLDIMTVPVTGGTPLALTQDEHIDWNPVWAPDGTSMYFVSDRGGSTNIWRVPIDRAGTKALGEPEPITSPSPFATHLSISGDGRRLAYSAIIESQNLYQLELDPATAKVVSEPKAITTGSRFWANPDPSPDGTSVVAYSQVNPEGDLYVFRTDGSGTTRQLTSDEAIDRVPRWSPDGAWITTFSDRSGQLHIWRIRPDGSDLQQLSTTDRGGAIVAWSPDAKRFAYNLNNLRTFNNAPSGANVLIADADAAASSPQAIAPGPPTDGRFVPNSWSADGEWIAGQQWYGVLGIFRFSPRRRIFERLTDIGEWPVWFPDNRRILFVSRGREFHVLDTRTKTTTVIYSTLRDTLGPPRLTRDGRRAFFSRRVTESDIWMVNLP